MHPFFDLAAQSIYRHICTKYFLLEVRVYEKASFSSNDIGGHSGCWLGTDAG